MAVGMLEVLLVDARELRDRHFWCGLDCLIPCLNETKAPYAQIQYGAQNQTSCLAQEEGKKRVWNEKFRFQVECEEEEDDMKNKVVLSTVEKHQFFPDFLVGKTTIYVKDVILRGMEEGKVVHGPHKYRVVRQDKTYSGEITVTVTFIKVSEGDFRAHSAAKILQPRTT
ncbi:elicitor-responsive protein 1 [Daucus carota subsp. sativus]|uniref:elicitor-responsive protein 1 n=1 Tax=Daucus carota subsp. sativus TaxID=79200 RepID=UPI0007EF6C87|nr:PREDICTED: elicitor-responsive protein 1-like isoform X2 [Daucus carota subsp. sativus]